MAHLLLNLNVIGFSLANKTWHGGQLKNNRQCIDCCFACCKTAAAAFKLRDSMSISRSKFLTNDGIELSFQASYKNNSENCLLLIHGFSGSSDYFVRNLGPLSQKHSVVALDLRGHGESDKTVHGFHVSRLASDLHDLVIHLRKQLPGQRLVGIGCSIGAAILWMYTELYTCKDFHKFVFVDQAPLQNYTADNEWSTDCGNYGCHDPSSLAWNQASLIMNFEKANAGLVASCLGYRFQPEAQDQVSQQQSQQDESFFTEIAAKCHNSWLAKLSRLSDLCFVVLYLTASQWGTTLLTITVKQSGTASPCQHLYWQEDGQGAFQQKDASRLLA